MTEKEAPTSERCFIAREFGESLERGKHMTVDKTGAPGDITKGWRAIDWHKARREIRRLQMRLAKATKEGKHGKVNALQWLLTHSFYAKAQL
jgi:hypothetical protein